VTQTLPTGARLSAAAMERTDEQKLAALFAALQTGPAAMAALAAGLRSDAQAERDRALQGVVEHMRSQLGDVATQLYGCQALFMASFRGEQDCEEAGAAGAVAALVAAMRAHPAHQGVQLECCLALGNLCAHNALNAARAGAAGAVAAVLKALRVLDSEDPPLLILGCPPGGRIGAAWNAVSNLSARSEENAAAFVSAGLLPRVVAALHIRPALVYMQSQLCSCISHLLTSNACRLRAIDAGAIDAVLALMVLFPVDAELNDNACCALSALYGGGNADVSLLNGNVRVNARRLRRRQCRCQPAEWQCACQRASCRRCSGSYYSDETPTG